MVGWIARKPLWIAGILIPPVLMAFFISYYGVNVPFWDQWVLVPLLEKFEKGALGFSDLWAQHNEHRIFFPKLIMIGLAHLSGWDIRYELGLNFVLACFLYLFIFFLLKQTLEVTGRGFFLWASVFFSWIVFSTVQFQNWLWGWQVSWFLNVLALAVAVWALTTGPKRLSEWKGLFLGIVSAVVGSFSLASGLFIWLAGGFILIVREGPGRRFLVWTAFALGTVAFYFVGYTEPPDHASRLYFAEHPGDFAYYLLIYIGSPLIIYLGGTGSFFVKEAAFVGFLFLALFLASSFYLVFYHVGLFKKTVAWPALALYVLLTAAATGLGRAGFGVGQALGSRYTTISMLFIMSTVVSVSTASLAYIRRHGQFERRHALVLGTGGIFLIVLFVVSYLGALRGMADLHAWMVNVQTCVEYLDSPTEPCLGVVYPNGEKVLEKVAFLRTVEWAGLKPLPFSFSAKVIEPSPQIGWLDNARIRESDRTVEVSGWAVPADRIVRGRTVVLISRGHILAQAEINSDRPDVAKTFSDGDFLKSGWRVSFNISKLQKGENVITAYLLLDKETLVRLNGQKTVLLEE